MEVYWFMIYLTVFSQVLLLSQAQDCEGGKQDIVFVVDSSGSIRKSNPADGSYDNWDLVKQFINQFVERLDIGPTAKQIGLVEFGNEAHNEFFLNTYTRKSDIQAAVNNIPYLDENTNTSGGLYFMRTQQFTEANGDRSDAQRVCILLTDGNSTRDTFRTIPEALLARQNYDIKIYVIGITEAVNRDEIRQISSWPQEENKSYWLSPDFNNLQNILSAIEAVAICTTPPPTTTTTTTTSSTTTTTTTTTRPPQPPPACSDGSKQDIVFVVDSSGSIRAANPSDQSYDNWNLLLNFIVNIVDKLTLGDNNARVGLVLFGNEARSEFYLNTYSTRSQIRQAVLDLPFLDQNTNTSGGLYKMRTEQYMQSNGHRPDAEKVAIVITDGESTTDNQKTIPEAQRARAEGVEIFCVGVTDSVNEPELRQISSNPQELNRNYWKSADFQQLGQIVDELTDAAVCPTPAPAPTTAPDCYKIDQDIAIVVDSSGSIRDANPDDRSYDNWELLLEFVENFVNALNIGYGGTRVGLIRYSTKASLDFDLNDYYDKQSLKQRIRGLNYIGGNTNTSGAIRLARQTIFTENNGDRDHAKDIIILITDGYSTIDGNLTIPEADLAKADGIEMFVIGITNNIKLQEIMDISSEPKEPNKNYWQAEDFQVLNSLLTSIDSITCGEEPELPSCLTTGMADIVLIIDASESIDYEEWQALKRFLVEFIEKFDVSPDGYRFGLIKFGATASLEFDFSQGLTKQNITDKVNNLSRVGNSGTNIAHALELVDTNMFTRRYGDRIGVPDIGLILTDGQASTRNDDIKDIADKIKSRGIAMMAVGVSDDINIKNLQDIVSKEDYITQTEEYAGLEDLKFPLFELVCEEVSDAIVCPYQECTDNKYCDPHEDEEEILTCTCPNEDVYTKYCFTEDPDISDRAIFDNCAHPDQSSDRQEGDDRPAINLICPKYGPTTGGTDVHIWGKNFGNYPQVYIGERECVDLKGNDTFIHCVTTDNQESGPLPVRVVNTEDEKSMETENGFQYKAAPVIYEIEPLETIKAGGITITIKGDNFTSVANPIMQINRDYKSGQKEDFKVFPGLCRVVSNTLMYCPSPAVEPPPGFNPQEFPLESENMERRRRDAEIHINPRFKRQSVTFPQEASSTTTRPTTTELPMPDGPTYYNRPGVLDFQLGVKFDGLVDYIPVPSNITGSDGQIYIYPNPRVDPHEEADRTIIYRPGWPFWHKTLTMKGARLNAGVRASDYKINLGQSECPNVKIISDTELECSPPMDKPSAIDDNPDIPVEVRVGTLYFYHGKIEYQYPIWGYPEARIAIICSALGLFVIVVLIIILCVCISKNRKSSEKVHLRKIAPQIDSPNQLVPMDMSIINCLESEMATVVNRNLLDSQKITIGVCMQQGKIGVLHMGWMLDGKKVDTLTQRTNKILIKSVKGPNTRFRDVRVLLEESTILADYKHENVLEMIGICIMNNLPHIVFPYIENMDLRSFVRRGDRTLSIRHLLKLCRDVARGMTYLSETGFVHTDLAARNCVVTQDVIVKIADYGLSRDLFPDDYYHVDNVHIALPVKWMALEALNTGRFSRKSDVWSFGIVMWEVLTRGQVPYAEIENIKLRRYLKEGNRLRCTHNWPDDVKRLMRSCWESDEDARPEFHYLATQIEIIMDFNKTEDSLYSENGQVARVGNISQKSDTGTIRSTTKSIRSQMGVNNNAYRHENNYNHHDSDMDGIHLMDKNY